MTPNFSLRSRLAALALFLPAVAAVGQSRGKQLKTSDAPFLAPTEAVAAMDVPDGFKVDIFACEPHIGEPIAFTFGPKGRLWVVENYNYVNRRNHLEDQTLSRIQILDDTDSDGIFDTRKVFTEDVTFSSGIAVGHGGVYLGSPPHLLFIPDEDGDDVPDGKPEVLLDGWGFHDRHETLNSFLWGPDGWLYGCQGVFTQSFIGKPGAGEKDREFLDAGIWRFHPVTKKFEIFARGLSNPWGFDFNDVGHGFATCCVIPHLFHVVQGGVYHKQSKPHVNPYIYDDIKTIRDHSHLSAHGGARFYLGDSFPKEYRDQLFMCNIHEHAVLTDVMSNNGSSYIGHHGADFMPTNDPAWVGFSLELGPDGGMYILDWHDTDICGNAINFPDSGRIYRLQHKDAPRIERPDLDALTDFELADLQQSDNEWMVRQARTLLHHRAATGKLLTPTALEFDLDQQFAKAKTSPKRLRALWANHVIGRFADQDGKTALLGLLAHDDEHVRAWAVQLICESAPQKDTLSKLVTMAQSDKSPTVRQFLASAIQRLPVEQRWDLLGALSKHKEDVDDPLIPRLLWYALEPAVTKNPEKAIRLASNGEIPFLAECVARRMVSGGVSKAPGKGPNSPETLARWNRVLDEFAPGFRASNVGEGGIKKLESFRNKVVFQSHPKSQEAPCLLTRKFAVPKEKTTSLKARVSYHPHGDWQLRIFAGKDLLHEQIVSYKTVQQEWLDVEVDLSRYAGQTIDLRLENRANDWAWEFAYWGGIKIVSE